MNDRQKMILSYIVNDYIRTGMPVSSRTLSRQKGLTLSPATIRNTMADLEEEGYIYQTHVSSGRVPTDLGYRFFVDNLMRLQNLTLDEKQKITNRYQKDVAELDDVLKNTSLVLSQISKKIGLALSPPIEKDIITCFHFVPVGTSKLLAVLVTKAGSVKEHLFAVQEMPARDDLDKANNFLNALLTGETLESAMQKIRTCNAASVAGEFIMGAVCSQLDKTRLEENKIYVDGVMDFIKTTHEAPIDLLKDEVLTSVLSSEIGDMGQNVTVRIGEENEKKVLKEYSLITREVQVGDGLYSRIAIIGEKRVNYAKIISLVEYTGKLLEETMNS